MDRVRCLSLRNDQNYKDLDRISQLPDTPLLRILSNLSTREAVGTSVLSKRWKNLWTDLPILEFEWDIELSFTDLDCALKKVSFKNFVDTVLLHHRAPYLTSCRFAHLSEFDSAQTIAWFSALSTRQIGEIIFDHCHIDVVGRFSAKRRPFKLFRIESLSVLDLSSVFIHYPRNKVQFELPNLKTLCLYRVTCFNKDFFKKLVAGCHVLQELSIVFCDFHSLEIHSLTLSRFIISKFAPMDSFILEAPNLTKLYLRSEDLLVAEVFRGVSKTNTLHLDYHDKPSELDCENMPWFHHLAHLQLVAYSELKLGFILCMLHHCPSLQNLILHFDKDADKRDWMLPSCPPQCLLSSLKVFELSAHDLCKSDVHILKYFLKNGMVLEEMRLNVLKMASEKSREVLKKLLMPHRASSACRVVFTQRWM